MKLEKYLNEKVRTPGSIIPQEKKGPGKYRVIMMVEFNIYSNDFDSAQNMAEMYCKRIRAKGKNKVVSIEHDYSEEMPNK